ncbi:hypothetical protein BOX15_Mlig005698g1 [Macrostomum lignano]|uniref:STAS domain-containing protein n=1 Tax=Macrostomum lignano TaxID=282301 RepID=A0A267ECE9_9PLAT|nr:hypothetical protein BOX15_Mlig005698g1 [Macrostomum lignano]
MEPATSNASAGEKSQHVAVSLQQADQTASSSLVAAEDSESRIQQRRQQRKRRRNRGASSSHRPLLSSGGDAAGAVFEGGRDEDLLNDFNESSSSDSDVDTERSFRVIRPVYTQQQFDEKHGGRLVRRPLLARLRDSAKKLVTCGAGSGRSDDGDGESGHNCSRAKAQLLGFLPFIGILKRYNIRDWLLADFISGLTVGIMHIPQGMAYAFLAELPPYIGLYTSFFPPLIYFFFGTSRQVSMGTVAIISLLVGGLVSKNFPATLGSAVGSFDNETTTAIASQQLTLELNGNDSTVGSGSPFQWSSDPVSRNRVALACVTCLCVGLIQLAMGVLRLGFLTRYLSDPLISGFTMGVAIHVFSSQIKYVLGIKVPRRNGVFSLPLHYFDLLRNITETNFVTVGIAVVSIVILYGTKEFVNPKVRKRIKAPLPIELLIVSLGTILSYFLDLKKNYNVQIVGTIPTGIPPPELPDFSILRASMAIEIVTIAIIAFSVCVSLAKIFGKKHNYEVAPSQELIAYGICNTVGSFFHCWPAGTSLSRSAVQDSMGGKTQVAALFSSTLLLLVLLFIGKYFESVPNCCLSAIIIVAIKGMLEQAKEAPVLWRLSPYDFWTWIVACLGVVFLAVDYGLILGLAFSVCSIIVRTQSPTSSMLGHIPDTDLYKNVLAYDDIELVDGVKIFRYEGSLYFACAENFRDSLYHKSGVHPRKMLLARRKLTEKYAKLAAKKLQKSPEVLKKEFSKLTDSERSEALKEFGLQWPPVPVDHVILDASTWGYIDYVGVRALNQTIQEYKEVGIRVYLANPKCGIRACLQRSDFYEKNEPDIIYVSVHDAVLAAQCEQREAAAKGGDTRAVAAVQAANLSVNQPAADDDGAGEAAIETSAEDNADLKA